MGGIQNTITDISISMYLLDFLDSIGKILFSTEKGEVYTRQFHDERVDFVKKFNSEIYRNYENQ